MTRKELIEKYLDFFKSKNHAIIPSAPVVPENDPTVLFTTAGMHPLVPYLLGQPHPLGKRIADNQKCIRTVDIGEVGDTTHHTFFEMLGNWSLGDYFKKEAIEWSFEFLTSKKWLGIPIERLAVTVFEGDKNAPRDNDSVEVWKNLGIPENRIAYLPKEDNFWGPAGQTGPCGPCSEMFYWKDISEEPPEEFDTDDPRWVEIWNDVFMEYNKDKQGNFEKLTAQNVDTGMGVERTVAILNNLEDNYLADMWWPIIEKIQKLSNKKYSNSEENKKAMRIIADHIKAAVFIIADKITPSNTEQGYVLRRLIRRAIRYGRVLEIENFTTKVAESVFEIYSDYSELEKNKNKILEELETEEKRFNQTLEKGLNKFQKITQNKKEISGKEAFLLYQSYGFPIEMTIELAKEKNISVNKKDFNEKLKEHQEKSRTAAAGRFKSGLADDSEATTRLHTAAHLLLKALQIILKDKTIEQRGSNITPERLRLDFSFPRKLTEEEIEEIEELVNTQIQNCCEVIREEMSLEEAKEKGACGIFESKYGNKVSIYTIKNPETKEEFSKEICAGPHVKNTSELAGESRNKLFKIKKQSSVGAGVRRIKAVLE
ncbi:alanine--tRNA ligase [Candidatus Pacearchaeota archaeon]|nr:alanine--tRNA ligase [Candidatus Pacearchaeota archaeon]